MCFCPSSSVVVSCSVMYIYILMVQLHDFNNNGLKDDTSGFFLLHLGPFFDRCRHCCLHALL